MDGISGKEAILKILNREDPGRFVYAPNYWQWFTHRKNHDSMPGELQHCATQLDCIKHLGQDVFSRNIYADPYESWSGGLYNSIYDGVKVRKETVAQGRDSFTTLRYVLPGGELRECLRYIHGQSTLVQEKFLIDDPAQLDLLEDLLSRRTYRFLSQRYLNVKKDVGPHGLPIAGELVSPLKMLHLTLGPVETTYLLADQEERAKRLMRRHEENQLALLKEMMVHGVRVVMSMDNLDTLFHPPRYVEEYSASFYERASALCHAHDSRFFIHACGQQRANLKLISSLGVDGLEGVAYPPLGDVELEEAMELAGPGFIITGGISAAETTSLQTREQVHAYMEDLFRRMKPYRHRFILSASCNTAIETSWETIKMFHQAWRALS